MQKDENVAITRLWHEIKIIVDSLELDVTKNARGVYAAGVRSRHGLRLLRRKALDLLKVTLELDRAKLALKKNE